MEHMNLIAEYCTVFAVKVDWAIWYEDGGFKYADVFDPEEGWISYSCNTQEEWEMLTEQFPTLKKNFKKSVDNPRGTCYYNNVKRGK